jgi:multiple sugar transport system ATP-binding protein
MAHVVLENLVKTYPEKSGPGATVVHGINLEIRDREFMVLVGPSGCGKSTTLRMIAGLESVSGGTLRIDGRVVNDVAPKDRDIAMVFQNYALYPHMTVYENMAFGLKMRKLPKAEIDARVREASAMLGLDEYLQRRPKALSGGQRQRVAVGRAIVRKPKVFLFDEPLSNLDAKMRVTMRTEIARLHARLGVTMIYVTHDQVEAMTMGDRICTMKDGRIMQVDEPLRLYNTPANLFVAGFIGSPPMNLIRGRIERDGAGLRFVAAGESGLSLALDAGLARRAAAHAGARWCLESVRKTWPTRRRCGTGGVCAGGDGGGGRADGRGDVSLSPAGASELVARVKPTERYAVGQRVRRARSGARTSSTPRPRPRWCSGAGRSRALRPSGTVARV